MVNCINIFYLLFVHVYKSYQSGFQSHMYFWVILQTHAYVITYFLSFHQNSCYQSHIDCSHRFQNQFSMWFSFSTYFLILMQYNFIHCMINNNIVLFLSVNILFSCRLMTTILIRPDFIKPRTEVSQELTLIWWMHRATDNTSLIGTIFLII